MGLVRRHPVVTALVLAIVVLGVAGFVVVTSIDEPGPASVDDALDRLDGAGSAPDGVAAERPPEGLYLYAGEGEERLSFPPLDQQDGAEMPATVVHRGAGCWAFRIDFNAAHWQEWTWCRRDRGLVETGGSNGQSWDLGVSTVDNVSTFVCDPPNLVLAPGDEPGTSRTHACGGEGSEVPGRTTSEGPSTFVGVEGLEIGGVRVEALHVEGRRRMTGSQDGTEVTDAWFRADGLLLRYERDIEVRTESPVGAITYTEVGHFELTDLRPRT